MGKGLILSVILLASAALAGRAQDVPITALDGPVVEADSLENRPLPSFRMRNPFSSGLFPLSSPSASFIPPIPGFSFETPAQKAARINAATYSSVMASIDRDLYWHRPPVYSKYARMAFQASRMFLSNPFGFRPGYAPLMNPSFPWIDVYVPGQAPYEHPYSPEFFPQSIRLEYDPLTGTYKQVMVDWNELQKNMARSFGGSYRNEPVPRVPVTPVERMMMR